MIPFLALISVCVTLASFIKTLSPFRLIYRFCWFIASASSSLTTSLDGTCPFKTWYRSRSLSRGMSLSKLSRVAAGSLENASSVGASRVNGPSDSSVSTRPALAALSNKLVKIPAFLATPTIVSFASSGGINTVSIMWIAPFLANMSVAIIFEVLFSITFPSFTSISIVFSFAAFASFRLTTSAARTLLVMT